MHARSGGGISRPHRPISYQLEIEICAPVRVRVGSLGKLYFPAGRYLYTGSAKKNIETRVRRHLRGRKSKHWHVDYLLAAPHVRVAGVKLSTAEECALNRRIRGDVLFPGLGSSDCRNGCGSHLKYLGPGTVAERVNRNRRLLYECR